MAPPSSSSPSLEALLRRYLPAGRDYRLEPVSGLTGESWRIHTDDGDWLARGVSAQKTQLGVRVRREYRQLRRLANSGLAPRPRAVDRRWLLVEWLAGQSLSAAQWQETIGDGSLAACIALLHRQQRHGYPLDLKRRLAHYWQASDAGRRCPAWLRIHQRFMRRAPPTPLRIAPLHMDIHAGNLVRGVGGELRIIDWEYAADGDFALELAALVRGNALEDAAREQLQADYLNAAPGYRPERVRRQIAAWLPWVDYLMMMWYEVRWRQTGDRQFLRYAVEPRRRLGLPGADGFGA